MTVDDMIKLMEAAKRIGVPHFKGPDGLEFVVSGPPKAPQPVSKVRAPRLPSDETIPE